jgi:hypothetical protein
MIRDILISLVTFFVIEPFQAEFADRLSAAGAPAAIVQDVSACMRDGAPQIVDRITADWVWAATTAVQLTIGGRTPDAVLSEVAPACEPAIRAARPFVNGVGA